MASFRKRNVIVNARGPPGTAASTASSSPSPPPAQKPDPPVPGIRPSPINGQPTTSTGTPSLDSLLAGHAGLPLGCSFLIEEPGTTDYGGALLRYYAAEGIVQGHAVTVVGFGEQWVRDLPALVGDAEGSGKRKDSGGSERMKIAWRYERLGEFGSGIGGSRAQSHTPTRTPVASTTSTPFCHTFDLTKRLAIPPSASLKFLPAPTASTAPYSTLLAQLSTHLASTPSTTPHRVLIPSLLNPALYSPHACAPQHLLQFLHSLRALLREYPRQLTVMISLPTELYPRATALIRWAEILSDGVIELLPLPRRTASKAQGKQEEPQGLVKLWKLPVLGEKGGGVGAALGAGEDLAFLVTRRRFEIMAYSLPPADEDEEEAGPGAAVGAGGHGHGHGKATKVDLEF